MARKLARGLSTRAASDDSLSRKKSVAEAQYRSWDIAQIDGGYGASSLTTHDYLLRMALDGSGNVNMMKQTVEMFLDIFSQECADELGVDIDGYFASILELVKPKLDEDLVPKERFMVWYDTQLERLEQIDRDIEYIKQLLVSIQPVTYPGRIIMSATDDLETKVVAHYGGKKWRRIENFLRGVEEDDADVGRRFGEEYVCLRESNIPIHTHTARLEGKEQTGGTKWMSRDTGGQSTVIVNASDDVSDVQTIGTGNVSLEYQISPLEYENLDGVVKPHDNAPPYREVYIWECVEATDEEMKLVGPMKDRFTVRWDANGGEPWNLPERAIEYGHEIGEPPLVQMPGHELVGWFTKPEGGTQIFSRTLAKRDATFYAHWRIKQYRITFDARGGTPDGRFRKILFGQEIGKLPDVVKDGSEFQGWFDDNNSMVMENRKYEVDGDSTYWAGWKGQECTILFDANEGAFDANKSKVEYVLNYGDEIVEPDNPPTRNGYMFKGWWTKPVSGQLLESGDTATADITYYAHWATVHHIVTFDVNGGSEIANPIISVEHGEMLGKVPGTHREGYRLSHWSNESGENVTKYTIVNSDMTVTANWAAITFPIAYLMNGVGQIPADALKFYTMETVAESDYAPPPASTPGYRFNGWSPAAIPQGTTGDFTFNAGWTIETYQITFDFQDKTTPSQTFYRNYGEAVGDPPEVERHGYVFMGWYTKKNGNGEHIDTSTRVKENITFYAYWEAVIYEITFKGNGGKWDGDVEQVMISQAHGRRLILPDTLPSDDGVWGTTLFDNWYTEPDGGEVIDRNRLVDSNATYYAHWIRIITYVNKGNVQIANGVASGFSSTNYLVTNESLNFKEKFEIVMKAKTGSDITTDQEVMETYTSDTNLGFGVKNKKFAWEFVEKKYWDVSNGIVKPNANTDYWFKYARESDGYMRCYISTDGETWTKDYQLKTTLATYNTRLTIGTDNDAKGQYWRGSIDLDSSYINAYGYKYLFVTVDTLTIRFDPCNG